MACSAIKACFCRHNGLTSRKRNAECRPGRRPRRAQPAAHICGVVLLAKDRAIAVEATPCICALQTAQRHIELVRDSLKLVGDGGLEPPTSTMSTWRSTPELIALHYLPLIRGRVRYSSALVTARPVSRLLPAPAQVRGPAFAGFHRAIWPLPQIQGPWRA